MWEGEVRGWRCARVKSTMRQDTLDRTELSLKSGKGNVRHCLLLTTIHSNLIVNVTL